MYIFNFDNKWSNRYFCIEKSILNPKLFDNNDELSMVISYSVVIIEKSIDRIQ